MAKARFGSLTAAIGLGMIATLLTLILFGRSTVGIARKRLATIPSTRSTGVAAVVSDVVPPLQSALGFHHQGVCSGSWVTETVDSPGKVGGPSSLALAPTYPYTPHISYHEQTNWNLKHAWLSGTVWLSETIGPGTGATSLALAPIPPHNPCIAYVTELGRPHEIKFACWNGSDWTIQGVYFGTGHPSLALEQTYPYTPHLSVYRSAFGNYNTLYHGSLGGTDWCTGTWRAETVEPRDSEAGAFNSLALESGAPYTPHISYYASKPSALVYARWDGTAWLTETVDNTGDVGRYTSLALDSRNHPHISYYDHTNFALKCAWLSGTTWISQVVDITGEQVTWSTSGATSLKLDQDDKPYISYYHAENTELRVAHDDGLSWTIWTVDDRGDVGRGGSLALDQRGCPHVSYMDTDGNLKYAYIPAQFDVYLPIVMSNYASQ